MKTDLATDAFAPRRAPPRRSRGMPFVGDHQELERPSPERPVRGRRARAVEADMHFEPHEHPWAQVAYCASGTLHVSVQDTRAAHDISYVVPPSRAVWIAPRSRHSVAVLRAAALHTLYVDPAAAPAGWDTSRMIAASPLLRELILALEQAEPGPRETHLSALALLEIAQAETEPLGVPLPRAEGGDKRLRALCEAVLRTPGERATLADWARGVGASERTAARLFRDELATSYPHWRRQVVLAHALPLLARGTPVGQVAAACGYASESAFGAMVKAQLGQPPSAFQAR
ncbi:MAG: helix-turn-helix transcriptional regulator [Proteobacteria bacterium]|jgi:AraC-like DNA-binding protein|nr:helix-turn-helix transcriptional regulator [Pseudomonadota bacterium]